MTNEKTYKTIIIVCICAVSFSVFYYFVVRSISKDQPFRDCMARIAVARGDWEDKVGKSFNEGRINETEMSKFMARAEGAYMGWKDDCYKKFK